jgi:hypothetical protein
MEEQRGRVAGVEPAYLVLSRAEGHFHEFRPKEDCPHFIVLAIGDSEEILDGIPDPTDEAEGVPELFTDLTDYRLFRRLPRERTTTRQPVARWGSHCRNGPLAVSDDCIGG